MSATDAVIDFLRTDTPSQDTIAAATADLETFATTAGANADSPAVVALTQTLDDASTPVAIAWTTGTAGADAPVGWAAVCAAAGALDADAMTTAKGYAVADAVAAALGQSHEDAGWSLAATAGAVGAVATAAVKLELDDDALRHAIGICATQAAGLKLAQGTDAGRIQLGKAAANAVEAALLARNGFTAAADPLSGRRGMFALMSATADPAFEIKGDH